MQTKGIILDNYCQIEEIFDNHNIKRPFVCCGKSFQNTKIFEYLKKFDIVVFDNIRPNPRFEDMVDAADLFNKENCDFIIGAGGGSPIDSAKMIRLMTTNDVSTALTEPMLDNEIKSLYIPTTAGTGAEATKTSVFYVNQVDKFSVANLSFLPDYVILDESLLVTLPDYQRKCTCLDALTHAIESYWNVKSNEESKKYAAKAIELFFKNKDGYIANTQEGNWGMLMASYYGGKAINITGTTSAHAMCYNLTMNCGTAHGHSVAACLEKIWQYMLKNNDSVNDDRGREYVLKTFEEVAVLMGGKTASDGQAIFSSLLREFQLFSPKADENDIDSFVAKVNVSRLGNNPTKLSQQDVKTLYQNILL